mgnify:CR=1 FL=1
MEYDIRKSDPEHPQVSIVVPFYNEEGNVEEMHRRLKAVLEQAGRTYEIIYVDDGSRDRTYELLRAIYERDPAVRVVKLRRNFGQTAAMSAGFDHARGEIIVAMDADLQNDPRDIPRLLARIDAGFDCVSGWRKDRQDARLTRILPSKIANWMISTVTGVRLHDYGCSLKAYRREILEDVQLYGEMHRFIPALARWAGAHITEVVVDHHPRQFGTSKYGLSRTIRVFLDLLTVKFLLSYATRPIQVFGKWGLISGIIGFLMALWLSFRKLAFGEDIGNRPALLLAVLLILVGFQFITMGLLAELQARTYYEAQGKPIYAIRAITRSDGIQPK